MHLLFVANFAADTGYAWDTIEAVFRRVGERLVRDGHRLTIAYAALPAGPPPTMAGAPFDFVAFDYDRVKTRDGRAQFLQLLKERGIDALYLTDRSSYAPEYAAFRRAGIRRIILHDRTSGDRTRRGALARLVKAALHRPRLFAADCYIGVSGFVRDRLIEINGTPADRTFLVYNGIDLTRFEQREPGALHRVIGVSAEVPIVFSSGRAQPYKGIQVVIAAAALMRDAGRRVEFVFCGDGSYLTELKQMAEQHGLTNFHFLGRRRDVPALLGSAAVAVVPSLWAEAFGLTVVEAMVARVPLVATRTGGIPELVEDGVTGLLIEPNDANQMASAITRLLEDPVRSAIMAERAAETARDRFSLERAAENLYGVVSSVLDSPARMSRRPATEALSAR